MRIANAIIIESRRRGWFVLPLLLIAGCSGTAASSSTKAGLEISPLTAIVRRSAADKSGSRTISFKLKNRSSTPIHVAEVRPSCGCTVPEKWANGTLAAGETRELQVQLAVPQYGKKTSVIQIRTETNGVTATDEIKINLEGVERVVPHIESVPAKLEVRSYIGDAIASREFFVETIEQADTPAWFLGFSSADAELASVTLVEEPESKPQGANVRRQYKCRADVKVPAEIARPKHVLITLSTRTIQVGDPPKPILLRVERQPEIRCVPSAMFYSPKDLAEGRYERTLTIISNSGEAFDAEVEKPEAAWVEVEPIASSSEQHSRAFRIRVKASDAIPASTGLSKSQIRIRTTLRSTPTVDVPVTVAATRGDD